MPTYQYACTACGERTEAVQGFHDAPLTECAACSGALRKVFSAVGVVFKGSGFYRNDSRDKKPTAAKTDAKVDVQADSSSSSSSSSSSGTDAAPAKKTEAPAKAAPAAAPSTVTPAAKSA